MMYSFFSKNLKILFLSTETNILPIWYIAKKLFVKKLLNDIIFMKNDISI